MRNLRLILIFIATLFYVGCSDDPIDDNLTVDVEERHIFSNHNNGFHSDCENRDLTFFINPCFNETVYGQAILDAIANYNELDLALAFNPATSEGSADIVFDCFSDETGCFGGLARPLDGVALIELNIADYYDNCTGCEGQLTPTLCQATFIAMHEIGHSLGFGHTNNSGTHIPGTPEEDEDSVLNSGDFFEWCNLDCNFSEGDLIALEVLYGCSTCPPEINISGPKFICNIEGTATYCIPEGFDLIGWEVPGNMSEVSSNGNCITISLDSYNGYTPLKVNIRNLDCEYDYELDINTHEYPNFDIEYNGPVCLGDVVRFSILPIPSHQNLRAVDWSVKFGGLNIMSYNQKFAVVEALTPGLSRICATAINECGREKTYCVNVNINSDADCTPDDGIPNPK